MKILLDCTYLRNQMTGVDVYLLNLVDKLLEIDKKNFYIIVIDTRYNQSKFFNVLAKYDNYSIFRLYSPLPLQILYSSFFSPLFCFFKKIDVYHNPYFFGPLYRFKRSSLKTIITVHDLYHHTVPKLMNRKLNFVFKIFADTAIRKAYKIIAISSQTVFDVVSILNVNADRVELIHQAANDSLNKFFDQCDDSLLPSDKFFLTVGKIVPSKGLDELINAFSLFKEQNPLDKCRLVCVGSQPDGYVHQLIELIKRSVLHIDDVIFKGYVSDSQLACLYKNCIAVVVPSYNEGFGLPIVEAMRFDRPLIFRNIPSMVEVAGEYGLRFVDVFTLAACLKEIITNKDILESMSKIGKIRVNDFSWVTSAKKTLRLYMEG